MASLAAGGVGLVLREEESVDERVGKGDVGFGVER